MTVKKRDIKELKKDWMFYLERQQPLFVAAAFMGPYGSLLFEATGFQFLNQLNIYKNNTCFWYRSYLEMKKADLFFSKLIEKKDHRLSFWVKEGERQNRIADRLIKSVKKYKSNYIQTHYKLLFEQCEKILLYSTVIPYRILSAINFKIKREGNRIPKEFRKFLDLYEPLRTETRYPQLALTVFVQFWKVARNILKTPGYLQFSFSTPKELQDLFLNNSKVNLLELRQRKKWCLFWLDAATPKIQFSYDNTIPSKIGIPQIKLEQITEIKGNVACRGIARGRVRIINVIKDAINFKPGDIIVSIQTNPSLMSILKKCGGIVTNEGGIMCHAAIVGRELNKPCIIGTKIATKVLKDGDLVEVDAERGIVKILKRKG